MLELILHNKRTSVIKLFLEILQNVVSRGGRGKLLSLSPKNVFRGPHRKPLSCLYRLDRSVAHSRYVSERPTQRSKTLRAAIPQLLLTDGWLS